MGWVYGKFELFHSNTARHLIIPIRLRIASVIQNTKFKTSV